VRSPKASKIRCSLRHPIDRLDPAVLSGYGIRPDELDHAIRMLRCTIHGYALLKAANPFRWHNTDESVAWMIRFFDAGLTVLGDKPPDRK
jgi:hypothetical protein